MEFIPPADDLTSFLSILPDHIKSVLERDTNGLVEVVLDLGDGARVKAEHVVAPGQEGIAQMGAQESGPAGDQNLHVRLLREC